MEWMNRAGRPAHPGQTVAPNSAGTTAPASAHHSSNKGSRREKQSGTFHTISAVILLFSITLLTVAVIGFIANFRQNDESQFVDDTKMQAVFLNGGQVYFGKIRELNNKYVGVNDIYYLRVNQQVQPKQGQQAQQDISLVKLGCELHGPQDQMIINREQVVFWENLKTDGQVAKAVEAYKKANPNGQKCDTENKQGTESDTNQNSNDTDTTGTETTPTTTNP
jgi:hypothetical protein